MKSVLVLSLLPRSHVYQHGQSANLQDAAAGSSNVITMLQQSGKPSWSLAMLFVYTVNMFVGDHRAGASSNPPPQRVLSERYFKPLQHAPGC
jgi:hypothetical protein